MYNYNMDNLTIYKVHEKIYVKNKTSRYIVHPIQSEKLLNEVYNILANSDRINNYYKIVLTRDKKLTFVHNGLKFAIVEINKGKTNLEKLITEKILLPEKKYGLNRSNWYFLWSRKCDYIYKQAEILERKNKIASEPIDYFFGMAETAIAYLKYNSETNIYYENLSICHNRINDTEIKNPLNIVVDNKERDISEYFKYLFINKRQNIELIRKIINESKLKQEGYVRLYARMLYPSHYFDIYEKIVNNHEEEKMILEIIKRIDEYECYIREIYNEINKIVEIKKIDWI